MLIRFLRQFGDQAQRVRWLLLVQTELIGVRSPWHYLKRYVKKTGGLAVLPDAKLKLFKDSNPLQ
ncbi:hypothetical protein B9Z48_21115 [Limnohabitans sp. WS1]|nr:hypothetical protein B9Z48_21115 [Limnohabitans sp. WS1]